MHLRNVPKFVTLLALALAQCVLQSSTAAAQAWVGAPNSLDLGTSFTLVRSNGLYFDRDDAGEDFFEDRKLRDREEFTSYTLNFDAEYTTTVPGLAFRIRLPLQRTDYTGPAEFSPHGAHGNRCEVVPDDPLGFGENCEVTSGDWYVTDLSLGARYVLPWDLAGINFAPGFTLRVPLSDYPITGHAAPGIGLNEYAFSLDIGRSFGPALPEAYANFNYTFVWTEHLDHTPELQELREISPDITRPYRSDWALNLGYFILPELSLTVGVSGRFVHGGYTWAARGRLLEDGDCNEACAPFHDPLARHRSISVGGGVGYQFTDEFRGYVQYYNTVAGSSAPYAGALTLGLGATID